MKRFKGILVLAGGSLTAEALDRAVELARRNDAEVTLLDIQQGLPERQRLAQLADGTTLDLDAVLAASRTDEMRRLAAGRNEVAIEVSITHTPVFVEAIHHVAAGAHDLVVIPPDFEGRSGPRGSSTMHLLRKCPVPVMVLGAEPSADVAVAVGPFDDDARSSLDVTLLELGSSLAAMRGGVLHVLHAWRLVGESLFRSARRGPSHAVVDEMVAQAEEDARGDLARLLERVGLPEGLAVTTHLVAGSPGEAIPSRVVELGAGVLVMGSLARTGISGLLIGNTAERILEQIECSVLTVKPPGFVSPIQPLREEP